MDPLIFQQQMYFHERVVINALNICSVNGKCPPFNEITKIDLKFRQLIDELPRYRTPGGRYGCGPSSIRIQRFLPPDGVVEAVIGAFSFMKSEIIRSVDSHSIMAKNTDAIHQTHNQS